MKTVFLVIATVLTLYSVVPYLRDILRGVTKPNLVSWITWTLLTGVATLAAIDAGEYFAAIFTGAATAETSLVVMLGLWKKAYVKYTTFDIWCQVGAIVGIVIWQFFDSPALGVVASVVIDFIGALPTLRHSWHKPNEETWQAFAFASLGGGFAILAFDTFNWVNMPYAVYILAVNIAMVGTILYRRKTVER